jgi:predicted RNase H-like nuclease (RuvC/YqgF family)
MKAAVAREVGMPSEERIVKLESDASHALSTLMELKDDAKSMKGEIQEVRGEVQEVRGEVHELRVELHSIKADTAKEFGLVRAEIEKLRTAIESTKVWFLVTCFGAVFSGIGAVVGLHALKLF